MMRTRIPSAAFFIVSGLASLATAQADETASLPFIPYPSSYLAKGAGKLFVKGAAPLDPAVQSLLTAQILSNSSRQSTADRFDQLRGKVLGQTIPIKPVLLKNHFVPDAESWEGSCMQWSAASLDPAIERLLASTSGVICGDLMISFGEIKELFTALYSASKRTLYCGRHALPLGDLYHHLPSIRHARDFYGFDALPAHVFDREIFENLKAGRGVVLDVDPGYQEWNQPVYSASALELEVSFPKAFESTHLLERAPAYLFEGKTPAARELLTHLKELDLGIQSRLIEPINPQDDPARVEALSKERDTLTRTRLKTFVDAGQVALQPGIQATYRQTTVSYGDEVSYADPSRKSTATQRYDYYLFKKDGVDIDSVWDTDSQGNSDSPRRPGYLWVPVQLNPTEQDPPGQKGLLDLIHLIQSNGCIDITQVLNFHQHLDQALSGNHVTDQEKHKLLDEWAKVKTVCSIEEIKAKIQDAHADGISIEEFK